MPKEPAAENGRVIIGTSDNEDAAILHFPAGKAIVQTLDFFTPIVNDPYKFGQIAAANSLSDVYAMGGEPWCAMNIVCFPIKDMPKDMLRDIILGGYDKTREAGAVLAGGHSVEDPEIKYGLSVTGIIDPDGYTSNAALRPGDQLLLTKPIGTGVIATAIKANWDGREALEDLLYHWASKLNNRSGQVLRDMRIKAATDVTGFGLGGHLLEMARASRCAVHLYVSAIPFLPEALDLAAVGMIPAGSFANKKYCGSHVSVDSAVPALSGDLVFDAQTSGGLILAVPEARLREAVMRLEDAGELAAHVGEVTTDHTCGHLSLCP